MHPFLGKWYQTTCWIAWELKGDKQIMDNKQQTNQEYYTLDVLHLLKTLWRKAWLIAVAGFLVAAMGFVMSAYVIAPKYTSSVMLYVNNSSFSLGNTSFSISSSEISAAQSLVKTYVVMLQNRTTLETVIDKAKIDYTYDTLKGMIKASSVNETEVMKVTVTSTDPYEASKIANAIGEVLPVRISEIIDGATMEVVDSAVPDLKKVEPSITKYTAIGFILGVLLSMIAVLISAMMDDTIHDEEYILQTYDYPILAKVPNLLDSGSNKYGGYYGRRSKKMQK